MDISICKKVEFPCTVVLLVVMFCTLIWQPAVVADERDFPPEGPEEELIREAIKFIRDNEGANPTDADEELTEMLDTNAADDMSQIREETDWRLGRGATNGAKIKVGLPPTDEINTDITTPEGFAQVKTLAETLYHEWIHWKRFQQYNGNFSAAARHNWAACQPYWVEIEAYYEEIKLVLEWKLMREQRLVEIQEPDDGERTPQQQAEAERLEREVADLEAQVDDVVDNYLSPSRNINAKLSKSYEGNIEGEEPANPPLADAFQRKTNQEKHDEVVARLADVSSIDPDEAQRTIDEKVNDKVEGFRPLKIREEAFNINTGNFGDSVLFPVFESGYQHSFKMTTQAGTFYAPTEVTINYIDPNFMDPWRTMGYTILSPVYYVSAPVGAMTNSAYPARVALSYNAAQADGREFHIYGMSTVEDGHTTPLFKALPGELIDYGAGIISGDSNELFSLYVVMDEIPESGIFHVSSVVGEEEFVRGQDDVGDTEDRINGQFALSGEIDILSAIVVVTGDESVMLTTEGGDEELLGPNTITFGLELAGEVPLSIEDGQLRYRGIVSTDSDTYVLELFVGEFPAFAVLYEVQESALVFREYIMGGLLDIDPAVDGNDGVWISAPSETLGGLSSEDEIEVLITTANITVDANGHTQQYITDAWPDDGFIPLELPTVPISVLDPSGLWQFEEGSGVTADDSSDSGQEGTLVGGATFDFDLQRGSVMSLDGTGWIEVGAAVAEMGNADFSIVAWINTTQSGGVIVSKQDGDDLWEIGEKSFYITPENDGSLAPEGVLAMGGCGHGWIASNEPVVTDGQWHHVAVTFQLDLVGNNPGVIYVDGVPVADYAMPYGQNYNTFGIFGDNPNDTVYIGRTSNYIVTTNFVGFIDDVAFFRRVLTEQEIMTIMEADF